MEIDTSNSSFGMSVTSQHYRVTKGPFCKCAEGVHTCPEFKVHDKGAEYETPDFNSSKTSTSLTEYQEMWNRVPLHIGHSVHLIGNR